MKLTLDFTNEDMMDAAEMVASDHEIKSVEADTPLLTLLHVCKVAGLNVTFIFDKNTTSITIDYDKPTTKASEVKKPDDTDSIAQFPEEEVKPEPKPVKVEDSPAPETKNAPEKESVKAPEKGALISNTLSFLQQE